MCYYITGTMDRGAFQNTEVVNVFNSYGRRHEAIVNRAINQQINAGGKREYFRYTKCVCDCDTALGEGDPDTAEIGTWLEFYQSLSKVKNLKYVGILKHWYKGYLEREKIALLDQQCVHVDELTADFLANMKDDIYYKIYLYPDWKKHRPNE